MRNLSILFILVFISCGSTVHTKKKVMALETVSETPVVGAVTTSSATVRFRTSGAADVAVEYATNSSFSNSTTTSEVTTASANDFTGQIDLCGLTSNVMYWYRLIVDGNVQSSPYVQKFKTLGTGSDCVLAVFSDVANRDKYTSVYRRGKDNGPNLALQIGDLDHRNPSSLSEARVMHRDMKNSSKKHGGKFSEHILTKMGLIHIWDDHDYCGQDEDRHCAFRSDAWKAFKEHWPTYALANGDNGLWHKFICGDAEVFVLDTRSQRDNNADTDDSNKSMLDGNLISNDQKDWLKDAIAASSKTWKIIVSSVTTNMAARPNSNDHWYGGFSTEATEMKNWLSTEEITGVVLVTGDLHTGGAVDDGTNSSWAIPELCVAHTNLSKGNSKNLGTWSEGVTAGTNGRNGYGLVTITSSSLKLEARAGDGTVRHSLTLIGP